MSSETKEAMTSVQKPQNASSVCSEAAEVTDKVSSSLWKPMLFCCVYVMFLRYWYYTFKAGGSGVFADVYWSCPIAASVIYLAFVFGMNKYMENKKPMALKDYMLTYNLYQTIINLWCVLAVLKEIYVGNLTVWGNELDTSPKGFKIAFLVWVHYNNKFIELLDTVFMVLRKKHQQITFLHMYHHILIIWAWFFVCKYACGGDAYFGMFCNSLIHVFMYSYYGLALLKINTPWKKWLTNLQLVQFAVCLAHSIYVIIYGIYPFYLACLQLWVMLNMLVLFGDFYRKAYLSKRPATKAVEAKSE